MDGAPNLSGQTDVLPKAAFNACYAEIPPWEVGHAQPEFAALIQRREIAGEVLDAGCGTGTHTLLLAALGHKVLGVDFAPAAIDKAREKARGSGSAAEFQVCDALELNTLKRTFDTVLDSGLFHCLSDENRARYVTSLASVLKPGGTLLLMCFCELETGPGPRRVTQAELRTAFSRGWTFSYIREGRFESNIHEGGAKAWVASIQFCGPDFQPA